MRVIAGKAGGIPLRIPKSGLRPTMDMVRGAIFSSLAESVPGARVLDLFAGSGSLGIEALSRGAESALLVESDRRACEAIRANLLQTRLEAEVVCMDVFSFLARRLEPASFDLAFADPPYLKEVGAQDIAARLLQQPALAKCLVDGGILVLEVARAWPLPDDSLWNCLKRKRYGATETLFLVPRSTSDHLATHSPP